MIKLLKPFIFITLFLFSCEAIDSPDPFNGVLPCSGVQYQQDFCKLEVMRGFNTTSLTIIDYEAPDYGFNEYLALVQYNQNGQYQCVFVPQNGNQNILVQNSYLINARVSIIRSTIGEEGNLMQQVDSKLFNFTNGNLID
jgi:hypothetical protein